MAEFPILVGEVPPAVGIHLGLSPVITGWVLFNYKQNSIVYLSRDSSLGGNYNRRKHVGRDKSFPLEPVAGFEGKEEKRLNRRGYSLERGRKVKHRAVR